MRAGSCSALQSEDQQGEGVTSFLQGTRFRPVFTAGFPFLWTIILSLTILTLVSKDFYYLGTLLHEDGELRDPSAWKGPRAGRSVPVSVKWMARYGRTIFPSFWGWMQKHFQPLKNKNCRCVFEGEGRGRGSQLCRKPEPSCRMFSAHMWSVTGHAPAAAAAFLSTEGASEGWCVQGEALFPSAWSWEAMFKRRPSAQSLGLWPRLLTASLVTR